MKHFYQTWFCEAIKKRSGFRIGVRDRRADAGQVRNSLNVTAIHKICNILRGELRIIGRRAGRKNDHGCTRAFTCGFYAAGGVQPP